MSCKFYKFIRFWFEFIIMSAFLSSFEFKLFAGRICVN